MAAGASGAAAAGLIVSFGVVSVALASCGAGAGAGVDSLAGAAGTGLGALSAAGFLARLAGFSASRSMVAMTLGPFIFGLSVLTTSGAGAAGASGALGGAGCSLGAAATGSAGFTSGAGLVSGAARCEEAKLLAVA